MSVRLYRFALPALLLLLAALALVGQPPKAHTGLPAAISFCGAAVAPQTLSEAQACMYQPRAVLSTQLMQQPVKWAKLQIDTGDLATRELAVTVSPHFIKQLTLFTPAAMGDAEAPDGWYEAVSGTQAPAPNTASVLGGYVFVVNPPANDGLLTAYLKIESATTPYVAIAVQPWPSPKIQNQVWVGTYLGCLLLVLVFSCFSLALDPNLLMRRFTLYIAAVFLSVLMGSGFWVLYIMPSHAALADTLFRVLLCVRLAAWVWLAMGFLKPYATPRAYNGLCWLVMGAALLCVPLAASTLLEAVMPLLLAGLIVVSLAQIWALLRAEGMGKGLRFVLAGGYGLNTLLTLLLVASVVWPQPPEQLPLQLTRATDFLPPLLLLAMIVFKNRETRFELESMRTVLTETQLQAALERKLLDERRMLVDMLTHELKNPLASIGFAADSLAQDDNAADKARRLRNIRQSIENMDAVIERCSLVNALEQTALQTAPMQVDISVLVHSLVSALPNADRVRLDLEDHLVIYSDRNLLRIVISNLLDNALKYAEANSVVAVSTRRDQQNVFICFENPVSPMLMPDKTAVFTRFYRHPNAHHVSGTGLGLYLVHELCIQLGGEVRFFATDNVVTFEVELPNAI